MALIDNEADPNDFRFTSSDTPLHAALTLAIAKDGDSKLLEYLLSLHDTNPHKFSTLAPDITDALGDTLLHAIAKAKSSPRVLRVIEFLRALNIDPDIVNREGKKAHEYLDAKDRRRRFLQGSDLPLVERQSNPTEKKKVAAPVKAKTKSQEASRQRIEELVHALPLLTNLEKKALLSDSEDDASDDENVVAVSQNDASIVDYDIEALKRIAWSNLEWEVDVAANVWRILSSKKIDKNVKITAVKNIHSLASGNWQSELCLPLKPVDGVHLHRMKLSDSVSIIWQRTIAFSERRSEVTAFDHEENRRIYAEIIRIWDIVHEEKDLDNSVVKIVRSNIRGRESIARKQLFGIRDHHGNGGHGDSGNHGDKDNSEYGNYNTDPHRDDIRSHGDSGGRHGNESDYHGNQKRVPALFMEIMNEDEGEKGGSIEVWTPPASSNENEYHIMKFYTFSAAMVECILATKGTTVDFPFNVTDTEYTYIRLSPRRPSPLLILGRSGTGKTICCLYRLWLNFLQYWDKASLTNNEPLIPRKTAYVLNKTHIESESESDSEDDNLNDEDLENNSTVDYDHLHQVFITKNPVLTKQVKSNFLHLCKSNDSTKCYADASLPTSFQSVPANAYPLFLTSRQFLLILDGSLPGPFFKRHSDGSLLDLVDGWEMKTDSSTNNLIIFDDISSDEEDNNDSRDRRVQSTRREVTYEVFAYKLWPRLKKASSKKKSVPSFHPSLVWMEIVSFIKGSVMALSTKTGYLTLDMYRTLGRKQAPHFTGDRDEVYTIFTAYQRLCTAEGYFDECDVIHHVYNRLQIHNEHSDWLIHQVFVDEVQDFTQSELSLMITACNDPNAMFFTGDTAQSIMRGVAFRFSDLKMLFHGVRRSMRAVGCTAGGVRVPRQIYKLTQNYRSHAGVIRLANSVIDLLKYFFPHSFDHTRPDEALFTGPAPILFDTVQFEDLALILRGNERKSSSQSIDFGAHQVILVPNDEARDEIPDELRHCLVLTIYESKGLEFDDVLLFNFFKDSVAQNEWRVVSQYLNELAEKQKVKAKQKGKEKVEDADGLSGLAEVDLDILSSEDRAHPLDFNPDRHKILNSELKYLYTAITRARVNVWIYDQDTEARKPMFEYFKALRLVRPMAANKQDDPIMEGVFVKSSSNKDWRRMGKEFYRRNQFLPAIKCFQRSGDVELCQISAAHQRALAAQQKPQSESERRLEFLFAAESYLECAGSGDTYVKAAQCLRNAREFLLAAQIYRMMGKLSEAAHLYKRCGLLDEAIVLYEQVEQYDESIRILCQEKRFQEALQAWFIYDAKVKECMKGVGAQAAERLHLLRVHRPEATYDQRKIAFRVADMKLMKDDIEGVRHILAGLGWSHDRIADWMGDRGKNKAAAMLLEKEGKLLEAAERYRELDDVSSAVRCLEKCKDLSRAKRQLADCYLLLCRRLLRNKQLNLKPQSASDNNPNVQNDSSTNQNTESTDRVKYRKYMDQAMKYYEDLNQTNMLGECLLLEGAMENDLDLFQAALEQFEKGGWEIGQIESIYEIKKRGEMDSNCQTTVLRRFRVVFNALNRKSGSVFDDILQFYGVEDYRVDSNSESRLRYLNSKLIGQLDKASIVEVIKDDLVRKLYELLKDIGSKLREDLVKCTLCKKTRKSTNGSCQLSNCFNFHGNFTSVQFVNYVKASKALIFMHGILVDLYLTDSKVKAKLDWMRDHQEVDFYCHEKLMKSLFLDRINYATDRDQTALVFTQLWKQNEDEVRKLLAWKTDLRNREEKYFLDLARNTNSLMMIMYSLLASGEFRKNGDLSTFKKFLIHVERLSKGEWVSDFREKNHHFNYFRLCLQSFTDHYSQNEPFVALRSCNRFLSFTATTSRLCKTICPSVEMILPLFEFQFIRGMLLYTKANPDTPVFFPQSYLRLMNLFDTLCSLNDSSMRIVDTFTVRSNAFHTNLRSQLRSLCEVFFGVRARQFNMLKESVKSHDSSIIERVMVLSLVMLLNVGLMIDENITFNDYKNGNRQHSVSLEEVIMRRLQRLHNDSIKSLSPRLKQFSQSIQDSEGLLDIGQQLKSFLNETGQDQLLEACWIPNSKWEIQWSESHELMENCFMKFDHDQCSDAYKILQDLHDGSAESVLLSDDKGDKITNIEELLSKDAKLENSETEITDLYVTEHGCDICGTKFLNTNTSSDISELKRNHPLLAQHQRNLELYKEYEKEIPKLTGSMISRLSEVDVLRTSVRDPDPDLEEMILDVRSRWRQCEAERKYLEHGKHWEYLSVLRNKLKSIDQLTSNLLLKLNKIVSQVTFDPTSTGNTSADTDEHLAELKIFESKRRR